MAQKAPSLTDTLAKVLPRLRELSEYSGWPRSTITDEPGNIDALWLALETGPYGRCVYSCDNDVVDHQTVNVELESGASVVLFMHGHSHRESRTMRYDGARATLFGQFHLTDSEIQIHDHLTGKVEIIRPELSPGSTTGHGGGDEGVMHAFVRALREGRPEPLTSARASLESHLTAFAAEKARVEGTIVDMGAYRQQAENAV